MPLDAASLGLVPVGGGSAPPAAATGSFPEVPVHPAPDGQGWTNLSDADYAKFNAGQPGPAAIPAPPTSPQADTKPAASKGLSAADLGLVPVQAAATPIPSAAPSVPSSPAQSPNSPPVDHASLAQMVGNSLAGFLEGVPRGLLGGKTIEYGNAAMQTPIRMLTGMQGPVSAFNEGLENEEKLHNDITSAAPLAEGSGQFGGGLLGGALAAPALGWARGASYLPSVGSYLARNAAFGGLMSALNGGNVGAGAALGALFPALHVGGSAISGPISSAYQRLAPILSQGARETSVGNVLNRIADGSPIQASNVGPLDMAQATNNPELAARVDLAPSYNADANAALRNAQQEAVVNQIGRIGTPATQADASSAFTTALRNARSVAGTEESRLWNVPALAKQQVTVAPVQEAVNNTVQGLDPVLRSSMSPRLQALVNRLNAAPGTTVRDLNGIRSELEQIGRTTADGTERSIARNLSSSFLSGMDNIPEIAGIPAVPPQTTGGWVTDALGGRRFTPPVTAPGKPGVAPNPDILNAYQTARNYTRQMRGMFGQPDAATLLAKNGSGAFRVEPSEGAGRFFNFSNGSGEGPQSITQLADFIATLKQHPGSSATAQQLKDSARSYVAASLMKAARAEEGQNFNPKTMQDFLRKNGDWIKGSGLFTSAQVKAAGDLMDYAAMLRRPEQLLRQTNSATQPRSARAGTFIDSIMSPWLSRMAAGGIGLAGLIHGNLEHALAGGAVSEVLNHQVGKAESAMRELMSQALLNPRVAQDLMMKASAANQAFLSPETQRLIDALRVGFGSDLLPQLYGGRPTAAPTGQK